MCRSRSNNITQIDLHIPTDATPNYLNFGIASRMNETFPPSAIKEMKIITDCLHLEGSCMTVV